MWVASIVRHQICGAVWRRVDDPRGAALRKLCLVGNGRRTGAPLLDDTGGPDADAVGERLSLAGRPFGFSASLSDCKISCERAARFFRVR